MGDTLDYERGKHCIGRRVKVWQEKGRGNGHNGTPAVLKGASPKCAQVRFGGHGYDTFVPWDCVFDWVGGNDGPAPKAPPPSEVPASLPVGKHDRGELARSLKPVTVRMTEPTALEIREMTQAVNQQNTAKAANILRDTLASAEVTVNLGDLNTRIEEAKRNLAASRQMVAEARAQEAACVKVFDDLRVAARAALEMIDKAAMA